MHEMTTRVRPSTRRPGRRLADERGETGAAEMETGAREAETEPVEAKVDGAEESDGAAVNN